jgi:hypothetical protein
LDVEACHSKFFSATSSRWIREPSISITREVCTLMIAPIFCSTQIRSMISGSTAAMPRCRGSREGW